MQSSNLLSHALQEARPVVICIALFSFFMNFLFLLLPLYSLQVLDRVLSTGSIETLFWLTVIMIAVFLCACFLQIVRSFVLIRVGEWIDNYLGEPVLALGISQGAGMRGMQNLRDLNVIRRFLTGSGLLTLFDAPWSVIALSVLFIIHSNLGMITLLGCILLVLAAWLNEMAIYQLLDEANETHIRNFQQIDIAMRNAEVIEAMGMTRLICHYWSKVNTKVVSLQNLASYRSSLIQGGSRFLRLSLQIAITGWGAYLAVQNEITSGSIIAASILSVRVMLPFDAAISSWKSFVEVRRSYHRLRHALESAAENLPAVSLPEPQGFLAIDKLTYHVPGRAVPVLKDISLALAPGDILGIIGPSAAGKSTLARLCVGTLKPHYGAVRLDNGDVCQWRREEFGQYVGYLPQNVELFNGTVRNNIARLSCEVSDEKVIKAARMAHAHEMILMLPHGYNTDIGPGGGALSAGQRQRIALARAFFGNPRMLVLDEPDANLDAEGEFALVQALENAKSGNITTLIVTHRRALLKYINKLLVLKEGEVLLFGQTQNVIEILNRQTGTMTRSASQEASL